MNKTDIHKEISLLCGQGVAFVVAAVIRTGGSTPGKTGFRVIFREGGETVGTVGGGAIEEEVLAECRRRLITKESGVVDYLLSANEKSPENTVVVPMACNGRMSVFFEVFAASVTTYIFGGGHVGQALLYHLKPLSFRTVLIDNRPAFATKDKNPWADQLIHDSYTAYAKSFNPGPGSFVVILTHGHEFDYEIAREILGRRLPVAYLGIIASQKKAAKMKDNLLRELGQETDIGIFHSPVGLRIGGDSAEEIAVSIVAEMIQVRTTIVHNV